MWPSCGVRVRCSALKKSLVLVDLRRRHTAHNNSNRDKWATVLLCMYEENRRRGGNQDPFFFSLCIFTSGELNCEVTMPYVHLTVWQFMLAKRKDCGYRCVAANSFIVKPWSISNSILGEDNGCANTEPKPSIIWNLYELASHAHATIFYFSLLPLMWWNSNGRRDYANTDATWRRFREPANGKLKIVAERCWRTVNQGENKLKKSLHFECDLCRRQRTLVWVRVQWHRKQF